MMPYDNKYDNICVSQSLLIEWDPHATTVDEDRTAELDSRIMQIFHYISLRFILN